MEIRKLLRSYGIRNFNLSNSTQIMVFGFYHFMCQLSCAVASYEYSVINQICSSDID